MAALQTTLNVNGSLVSSTGMSGLGYNPQSLVNINNVGEAYQVALTAEPAEIVLPTGALWFAVIPPLANVIAISHKWQTGDTGAKVNSSYGIPACAVDPTTGSFWLWSTSAVTVMVYVG